MTNFEHRETRPVITFDDGDGKRKMNFWQAESYCNALVTKVEGKWPFVSRTRDPLAFHICMQDQGHLVIDRD